jgi:hypothetical protein
MFVAPPQQIPMYEKELPYSFKPAEVAPVKDPKDKGLADHVKLLLDQYSDQIGTGNEERLRKILETLP